MFSAWVERFHFNEKIKKKNLDIKVYGRYRVRTYDPLLVRQMLSQLS